MKQKQKDMIQVMEKMISPSGNFYVKHTKTKILCIKNIEALILLGKGPRGRERTQEHRTWKVIFMSLI